MNNLQMNYIRVFLFKHGSSYFLPMQTPRENRAVHVCSFVAPPPHPNHGCASVSRLHMPHGCASLCLPASLSDLPRTSSQIAIPISISILSCHRRWASSKEVGATESTNDMTKSWDIRVLLDGIIRVSLELLNGKV